METTSTPGTTTAATHREHPHPTERIYVKVALWLAFVTAVEIWISYSGWPHWAQILSLLALSAIKFVVVVGYFMHLKFDHPALRKPFIVGMVLAGTIYSIVLLSMMLHD